MYDIHFDLLDEELKFCLGKYIVYKYRRSGDLTL
jgi:hypothetical protein